MSQQRIESLCISKGFVIQVGYEGITNIVLGEEPGPMGMYRTVEVWSGEQRHATFPFHQVIGVYFRKD